MLNKLTGVITATSTTLVELKDLMSALNHHMASVEQRLSNVEDTQQDLSCEVEGLKKQVADLRSKVDDQENCTRRNNVHLVGFPEGVKHGRPIKFLQETLPELLKLPPRTALEVERTHRSLAPKPAEGQSLFIVKFLHFPVREQILTVARSLGTLEWNRCRILVFPDLSQDLMERRRRFMQVKKTLREKGLKYGLFYPATLKLTCDGETRSFTEPQAVEEFLQQRACCEDVLKETF
uniref:L1 transposable element RRM domain-containing protein n=1 Tax=Latimeria chalumnae TaxID=7897 RepID=H3AZX6_LATCH